MIPGHEGATENERADLLDEMARDDVHARGEADGETPCGVPMDATWLRLTSNADELTCTTCATAEALRGMRAAANDDYARNLAGIRGTP